MLKIAAVIYISAVTIYILLNIVLKFINEKDDEKIADKHYRRIIISILSGVFISVLYIKYFAGYTFFKYFILMVYVTLTGYIDAHSRNVYTFLSNIFLAIGLIFLFFGIVHHYIDWKTFLISISSAAVTALIFVFTKSFEWGDFEVFLIAAIYMASFTGIINIFLALTIQGIRFIPKLISRKVKLKGSSSLCEYIAVSTFLLLLFS